MMLSRSFTVAWKPFTVWLCNAITVQILCVDFVHACHVHVHVYKKGRTTDVVTATVHISGRFLSSDCNVHATINWFDYDAVS